MPGLVHRESNREFAAGLKNCWTLGQGRLRIGDCGTQGLIVTCKCKWGGDTEGELNLCVVWHPWNHCTGFPCFSIKLQSAHCPEVCCL